MKLKHSGSSAPPLTMPRNPLQSGERKLGMQGINIRPHFAPGGMPDHRSAALAYARRPMVPPQKEPIHTGAINVPVAGRTDHVPITVPTGSYVIPADVVNHFGQDNTLAGHQVMEKLFKGGVIRQMRQIAGPNKDNIPIAAAGGEYVIPPETVAHIGNGSIKNGHAILDSFVKSSRADHIKTLKKLPGPKK